MYSNRKINIDEQSLSAKIRIPDDGLIMGKWPFQYIFSLVYNSFFFILKKISLFRLRRYLLHGQCVKTDCSVPHPLLVISKVFVIFGNWRLRREEKTLRQTNLIMLPVSYEWFAHYLTKRWESAVFLHCNIIQEELKKFNLSCSFISICFFSICTRNQKFKTSLVINEFLFCHMIKIVFVLVPSILIEIQNLVLLWR